MKHAPGGLTPHPRRRRLPGPSRGLPVLARRHTQHTADGHRETADPQGSRSRRRSRRFRPTDDCTQLTTVMEASRCPASARAGLGFGPPTSSATRATAPRQSVPGSVGGASHTPSPSGPTRSATSSSAAARVAGPGLRPAALQAAQRGGPVLQPIEAVAWDRHPLRQDRRVLPGSRHPRIPADVGVTFDDNS